MIFGKPLRQNNELGIKSVFHLRLTGDSPASDALFCTRITEAIIACWAHGLDAPFCDALTENDRGYFPRNGVLDRLYNPRIAFNVIKELQTLFSKMGKPLALSQFEPDTDSLPIIIECERGKLRIDRDKNTFGGEPCSGENWRPFLQNPALQCSIQYYNNTV